MIPNVIISVVSGSVIGYFTNWLAIKMLFRPHKEKRIFGVRLPFTPGLIPKERLSLAKKLGETISGHLLTAETIADGLLSEKTAQSVEAEIDGFAARLAESEKTLGDIPFVRELMSAGFGGDRLRELARGLFAENSGAMADSLKRLTEDDPALDKRLTDLISKVVEKSVGKFIGLFVSPAKIYAGVKDGLFEYLGERENREKLFESACDWLANLTERNRESWAMSVETAKISDIAAKIDGESVKTLKALAVRLVTGAIEKGAAYMAKNLDIARIVEEKINEFEVREAEEILVSVVKRELSAITWLGALLGAIIGLATGLM